MSLLLSLLLSILLFVAVLATGSATVSATVTAAAFCYSLLLLCNNMRWSSMSSTERIRMPRKDYSGKTRLALHIPSSARANIVLFLLFATVFLDVFPVGYCLLLSFATGFTG